MSDWNNCVRPVYKQVGKSAVGRNNIISPNNGLHQEDIYAHVRVPVFQQHVTDFNSSLMDETPRRLMNGSMTNCEIARCLMSAERVRKPTDAYLTGADHKLKNRIDDYMFYYLSGAGILSDSLYANPCRGPR